MSRISRRNILAGLAGLVVNPRGVIASERPILRLQRAETRETLVIQQWPLREVDHLRASLLLRDVRDGGQAVWVDPLLLATLARVNALADRLLGRATITVTSGYRTVRHNSSVEGAAQNSFHTRGQAADCRIAGMTAPACAQIAAMVGAGGIGLYESFTHVDTGPDRTWDRQARRIEHH